MPLAKAKQYALEMVKGIRPGYVPADPIKHLQLETLRATGEGPLAGLASLNIMGGDRHQWEHPRAIDRETLAEVLRSECLSPTYQSCPAMITPWNTMMTAPPGYRGACAGDNSASVASAMETTPFGIVFSP